MLVIEIHFLGGVYQASDFRNRTQPEWPPHPDRLFSALVAAAYQSELGEPGLKVLRWLECQPPPQIACTEARRRDAQTVFVPVNDPEIDRSYPEWRTRMPRHFPAVIPDSPWVSFIWPSSQPDVECRENLEQVALSVTYLGSSQTPVSISVKDQSPDPTWVPSEVGELALRVVGEGRLSELDRLFEIKRPPTPGRLQFYSRDQSKTEISGGEFTEMLIFRRIRGAKYMLNNVLTLTESLRRALLSISGDDTPAVLHGHDSKSHCGWTGLANVNNPYADGSILGAALLIPVGIEQQVRNQVISLMSRMNKVLLPGGRVWDIEPAVDDPRNTLQTWRWTRPARVWTSVSPVVLDRFPKKNGDAKQISRIIEGSCTQSGYPKPQEIIFGDHSSLKGVPPSNQFRTQRKKTPNRPYLHVTIVFDEPVRGPMLLGAGRYFGLGLMLPISDNPTTEK
jgi:CRISPR-associated protein Csb2